MRVSSHGEKRNDVILDYLRLPHCLSGDKYLHARSHCWMTVLSHMRVICGEISAMMNGNKQRKSISDNSDSTGGFPNNRTKESKQTNCCKALVQSMQQ